MSLPYDRPSDPAKRHSAALTDGPDRAAARAMLKAMGFTDEDLAQAHRRRGHDVDRDDALQPQPAPPGGVREGGHPGRRRHAHGVQHHRRLGRRDHGHRGHEGLARQPRGRGRFHRAGRPRPPLRRAGRALRLRQDQPRRGHGRGPPRHPQRHPLQRHDLPGHLQGRAAGRRQRLRGHRRLPRGQDQPRGAVRDRVGGLPGRGRLRRPVHGQHDEHVPGVPGPLAGRPQRHPGRGPAQGRGGAPLRRAGHGPRAPRRAAQQHRQPRTRSRTPSPAWPPRAAPPTPCCTCWPSPREFGIPLRHRRLRRHRRAHAAHRRPAAGRPLRGRGHRRRPAASASSSASCSRPGSCTATRRP